MHINLSALDSSTANIHPAVTTPATTAATNTSDSGSQRPAAFGVGGRGAGNTVAEAALRLAQAKRNFALAENAICRLQVRRGVGGGRGCVPCLLRCAVLWSSALFVCFRQCLSSRFLAKICKFVVVCLCFGFFA